MIAKRCTTTDVESSEIGTTMSQGIQGPVTKLEAFAKVQVLQIMTRICYSLNCIILKLWLVLTQHQSLQFRELRSKRQNQVVHVVLAPEDKDSGSWWLASRIIYQETSHQKKLKHNDIIQSVVINFTRCLTQARLCLNRKSKRMN